MRTFVGLQKASRPFGVLVGAVSAVMVLFSTAPAGASTGLALPPPAYLDVYRDAAEKAECTIDWSILAAVAGVVSNHTQPVEAEADHVEAEAEPDQVEIADSLPIEAAAASESDSAAIEAAVTAAYPPPPVTPAVFGPLLDGQQGRLAIVDTDAGALDAEMVWDRAVGPFQFIPSTWDYYQLDGNNDGVTDPQDLVDAATAAASLLCQVGITTDPEAALSLYLGTDTRNDRVFEHAAELRAYWQSLQPAVPASQLAALQAGQTAANVETVVVGGIEVAAPLANQTSSMLVAAAADGILLQGWGWRSHERQIELRAAHCADILLTPPSECTPPTATPGDSLHEIGQAIDFYLVDDQGEKQALSTGSPPFIWLASNASIYGYFNLPSEPWHWSTNGR